MSVGSKLALLIFGLFFLGSFFIILLMIWRHLHMGIELAFLITVASPLFAAGFGATIFIWGKLRESLMKGLDSVNENVLRNLWGELNPNHDPYRLRTEEMKKARDYLKRYGRFLGVISLHPIKWKRFDRFISLLEPFEENLKKILKLAQEELGERTVEKEKLLMKMSFELVTPPQMAPKQEEEYIRIAMKLKREQRKLIVYSKMLVNDLEKIRKEIYENLDNFFKENHLSILTHYAALR